VWHWRGGAVTSGICPLVATKSGDLGFLMNGTIATNPLASQRVQYNKLAPLPFRPAEFGSNLYHACNLYVRTRSMGVVSSVLGRWRLQISPSHFPSCTVLIENWLPSPFSTVCQCRNTGASDL
jgi:hypothetical protein